MGTEGVVMVESNSQYAVSPIMRQQGEVQGDVRMSGTLLSLRSEKCDGGFLEQI